MLRDIIKFVQSRTDLTSRDDVLREINYAWNEIWNSDDLPNSLYEMSVRPLDSTARISLPYVVGVIRGVKANNGRIRVDLNTPRPYYQDEQYFQSPYLWRILGISPLAQTIQNASQLTLAITEPESERFAVTLIGPTDNATDTKEQIIFEIGDTEKETVGNYTDCNSIVKDFLTKSNVTIVGANGEDYGIIPNLAYEARNTVIQITDKCFQCCNDCRCFDILFKKPAPILYYDEQAVAYPEVLMQKTMEWISMPKDGQEEKTAMYAAKGSSLLAQFNGNEASIEKRIDLGRGMFSRYTGSGWNKI